MNIHIIFASLVASMLCLSSTVHAQQQQPFPPLSDSISLPQYIHTVTMSSLDIETLLTEDSIDAQYSNIPPRFGFAQPVDLGVTNAGTWDTLVSGDRIWRLRIISSGAYSINLNFNRFLIPEGGRLFVYNEQKTMTIGAFTNENNLPDSVFATRPVKGDTIILEYNHPASAQVLPLLNIVGIVHGYRDMFSNDAGFRRSLFCQRNVHCPEGTEWQMQARSVAMVLNDKGQRWCSGATINDVTNNSDKAYFITADHCLSGSDPSGSGLVFIFSYESADCDYPPSEPSTDKSINGATIISRCSTVDIALLELSKLPHKLYDPDIYYAGWSLDDIAPSRIAVVHHPKGDIKKILLSSSIPVFNTSFIEANVNETTGLVESATSGAPAFDQNGRIIGIVTDAMNKEGCSIIGDLFISRLSAAFECQTAPLKTSLDPNDIGVLRINGRHPYPPADVEITVDQKRASDDRLANTIVERWDFTNSNFANLDITDQPATFTSTKAALEVLKGMQDRVENPNEKYHVWRIGSQSPLFSNVQNQRSFFIREQPITITSQFNYTKENVIIATDLFEHNPPAMGGEINFLDPWYIDFQDPLYNNSWRNRGMNQAFPHSRSVGTTGFKPYFTTPFQESPNHPYRGVFLNQNPLWLPHIPNYSLSVPEVQTINGVDYAAIGWYSPNQKASLQYPDRLETGVVFEEEDANEPIVKARLKGHLLSTSTTPPTKNNNQRKIAIQFMGSGQEKHLHAVYESGGRIYYTKSTNHGTSWSGEVLVSNFTETTSVNPSIAFEGNHVFVTYVEGSDIVTKSKDYQQDIWLEIDRQSLRVPMASVPAIAASLVALSNEPYPIPVCVTIWEDGDKKLKYSVVRFDGTPGEVEISGSWTPALGLELREGRYIGQTQVQPRYPSIVGQRNGTMPGFGIVWNEHGELYYSDLNVLGEVQNTFRIYHYNQAELVRSTAGYGILANQAPSITLINNTYPIIAYTCNRSMSNPVFLPTQTTVGGLQLGPGNVQWSPCLYGTNEIIVRMRSGSIGSAASSGWSVQTYASRNQCNEVWDPSISHTGEDPLFGINLYHGLRVVANDGIRTHSVGRVSLSSSFFVTRERDGYDPNLPVYGFYDSQQSNNLRYLASNLASSPFVHGISSDDFAMTPKTAAFTTHHVRLLIATGDNDTTFALYGIHNPVVRDGEQNETPIEWLMTVDTTTIQEGITIEERMRSDAFTVPMSGSMKYGVMLYARNTNQFEQQFNFIVKFISTSSGNVVLSDSIAASALPDSNIYAEYVIDLSSIAGQEVYLTATLSTTPDSAFTEVIDLFITEEDAEKVRAREQEKLTPGGITLDENRPNPFSASTSITFSIQESGTVRLSVYDLYGRLMKEIINGRRNAGRYTHTFSASELPSGVYLYRLEANGQMLTRRMSVIK